ncbi:hypothetical protein ACXY7D_10505 [Sphingomonas melonis]
MIADGDQKSVLLRLHDQIDESRAELSAAEICCGFTPAIDPVAVESALRQLVQAGLVVSIGSSPTRYRISRVGIGLIEQEFDITTTINPSTGIVHRSYSERPAPVTPGNAGRDWGKSGAIAGWISLILAIIGIAVAIWLDKN